MGILEALSVGLFVALIIIIGLIAMLLVPATVLYVLFTAYELTVASLQKDKK